MPMRNTHMDTMLVTIVNLASPAARSALGSVNEDGQISTVTTQFTCSTESARSVVVCGMA